MIFLLLLLAFAYPDIADDDFYKKNPEFKAIDNQITTLVTEIQTNPNFFSEIRHRQIWFELLIDRDFATWWDEHYDINFTVPELHQHFAKLSAGDLKKHKAYFLIYYTFTWLAIEEQKPFEKHIFMTARVLAKLM